MSRKLVDARGMVTDGDIEDIRETGFDDDAIAEVVAHVALNIFTNYFNQVPERTSTSRRPRN